MKLQGYPSLGRGIYRISDLSRYAHIPHATVYSWFKTSNVFQSDFSRIGDTDSVSFYDLIDVLVAYQFRKFGVTMKDVRRAYELLSESLDSPHPFCHRDLYTNGKRIIIREAKKMGTPNLQDAISKQQFFNEIQANLTKVSYSEATRLAQWWDIHPGIVVNPTIAMGEPVITGTGVTTFVVRNAYYANKKNLALVSGMYGISAKQVTDAVVFEDSIRPAA